MRHFDHGYSVTSHSSQGLTTDRVLVNMDTTAHPELIKTLAAYIRRADEGTLSRLLVETTILFAASRMNAATVLRDAATAYKVDTDAITLKVKQEFAAKAKAKKDAKPVPKARKAA